MSNSKPPRLDPTTAVILAAGGVQLPWSIVPSEGTDERIDDLRETLRLMRAHPRHAEFLQLRREGKMDGRQFVLACLAQGDA